MSYLEEIYQRLQKKQNGSETDLPDSPSSPSALAQEYERTQSLASKEMDEELKAIEETNPHTLYKEIVNKPSPPGIFKLRLVGRPIDLSMLEKFVVFKMSPRTNVTLLRYNDVKAIEETQSYGRHGITATARKSKKGLWIVIIVAIIMLAVGAFMLSNPDLLKGIIPGMS